MIKYKNLKFKTCPKVYEPSDDTFLLLKNLKICKDDKVLEIGTGIGIIAMFASQIAREVVATDINPYAIRCAKKNAQINSVKNIKFLEGNLFEPINEKFNTILFNPPYLPTEDFKELKDELCLAWDGGSNGRKIIDRFLKEVDKYLKPDGKIQLVQSSLSNPNKTIDILERKGFEVEITASKKLFFEELLVITAFK